MANKKNKPVTDGDVDELVDKLKTYQFKEGPVEDVTPAYTSNSWGIRKTASVRWICDTFEHSFDADNKLISTKVLKSSEPMSWSFILETWKLWAAQAISKMK